MKLNIPQNSIHDIKYFYNVISGIKRKGGRIERIDKTFEYFRKIINDYNDAKASKWNLSFKPREVNTDVIKDVIYELKKLQLIHEENGYLTLTNEGENISLLIEKKDAVELKRVFTKLMLENYNIFEYFLREIKKISNGDGIPIPFINSDVFNKCEEDSKKVAENYIDVITKSCPNLSINPMPLYKSLERAKKKIESIEKRTVKIKKLQSVIEKHIISKAFQSNIKSRRVYDVIRSRTTFLELTNYGIFDFGGFPAEVTYLISDFHASFADSMEKVDYSGGSIYINYPTFEEIHEQFKNSILKAYNAKKDDFGYTKIADVRDIVCRELKISDNLFDMYIKRIYEKEPHWISFTYSGAGDKITEKRLPIIFEKPMRELFTLLGINLRR